MIVPQWVSPESFPVPLPEDGGTSLFLRFKPGFDKQELQQAMEKVRCKCVACMHAKRMRPPSRQMLSTCTGCIMQ